MPNGTRKPRALTKQDVQKHLRCPSLCCPACKHLKPSYGRPRLLDGGFVGLYGNCNKCGARWNEVYILCDVFDETTQTSTVENRNDT